MVARDLALAGVRAAAAAHPPPLGTRVGRRASSGPQAAGVAASGEVTPHHLCLTDEAVRTLDPNMKMSPPLQGRGRPAGARRSAPRRHDRRDRNRPRAARRPREGRPLRGGSERRHRPRDSVRRALHATRPARDAAARDPARADERRAGTGLRAGAAADRGRRSREPRPARPRCQAARRGRDASARSPTNSWLLGKELTGRVLMTVADGTIAYAA